MLQTPNGVGIFQRISSFSGRLVPGQDPDVPDSADEQMNFGFSTGDEVIPEPYVYITAYPLPEGLSKASLPEGAYWHTDSWQGAVFKYEQLVNAEKPYEMLLNFLTGVYQSGADLMK